MAWYNKHGEHGQEQWNSRVAQKRLDLSASVEEALRDDLAQEELEPGETENPVSSSKSSTLIPPRLSLQSKYMPAIGTSGGSESLPVPLAEEYEVSSVENASLLSRFAQRLTSSIASFSGKLQSPAPLEREGSSGIPKIEGAPFAQPAEHTGYAGPVAPALRSERPSVRSTEPSTRVQNKQRVARRTTKVRLQVVPKPEETRASEEAGASSHLATSIRHLPAIDGPEKAAETIVPKTRASLSSSGSFESGQSDLAVANANITASSVVVVVLTGDPGPVVLQYLTLQPEVGFTVHLSAPAKNRTPFNYTIL